MFATDYLTLILALVCALAVPVILAWPAENYELDETQRGGRMRPKPAALLTLRYSGSHGSAWATKKSSEKSSPPCPLSAPNYDLFIKSIFRPCPQPRRKPAMNPQLSIHAHRLGPLGWYAEVLAESALGQPAVRVHSTRVYEEREIVEGLAQTWIAQQHLPPAA